MLVDAVIGTAETAPAFEQSLLAWSADHGRHGGRPTQLPPWLRARVTQAARRIFGSTGDCADALGKAAALLRALDGGADG